MRDHINNVLPDLPKGIDQPVVSKVDPDASPILYVTLSSPGTIRDTTELADKRVRRQIESINGVGQVNILGGKRRQINVWLDPLKLEAAGLTAVDVERALAQQNLSVPGGQIETGPKSLSLRVEGRVDDVAKIGRIVIRESQDHPTRIGDVARVEDGVEDPKTSAVEDGKESVVLSIRKQSGENTVAVVDSVKTRLSEVQKSLPSGSELKVVRDESASIRTSVNAVKEHLVLGALFAAVIVLIFLGNWRSTVIAALAIPVSIVGTFALMWAMGFTLNIITLLALALAVGIVIDDAIVVLENIVRFIEEKKQKPFVAAVLATRDIGLAVLATTLSLMAVFLPVAFMSGIIGRFLKSFGLTMAFAILVSLLVSFSLTPMLAARWLHGPPADGRSADKSLLERLVDGFYRPIESLYMVVLSWVMQHRWVVVVLACATLGSCVPLAAAVPKGFTPPNDVAEFDVNVRAPEGTSLAETRLQAERVARDIRAIAGVDHTLVTIGNDSSVTRNLANIFVHLVDPRNRRDDQFAIMDKVRKEVIPLQPKNLRIDVSQTAQISSGQSQAQVQYTLSGPDLNQLSRYTSQILGALPAGQGGGGRRLQPHRRQPRGARRDRPRARRQPRRRCSRRGQRTRASGRRSQGLDLRGGGQRLRYPRPRRRCVQGRSGRDLGHDGADQDRQDRAALVGREARPHDRSVADQPARAAASGHDHGQCRSRRRPKRGIGCARPNHRRPAPASRVPRGAGGADQRDRSRRERLRNGGRPLVHLHVPRPGGAVRVVAAPDHDHAVASPHRAFRTAVAASVRTGAVPVVDARASSCSSAS